MKRCPRCHSTMLLDRGGTLDGDDRVWKCLGCGREIYADPAHQAADQRLLSELLVRELRRV